MRGRGMAFAIVALFVATHGPAEAEARSAVGGDAAAAARLTDGEVVLRPETVELGGRRYVGGLGYAVIRTEAAAVARALADPRALAAILPRTKRVEQLAPRGSDARYRFAQGNALITAEYTLLVRHDPEGHKTRFWLDRSESHALDDAWGFFRYEPFVDERGPAVLLTYGILIDLGPGIARALYEERIRALALAVPARLRDYATTASR